VVLQEELVAEMLLLVQAHLSEVVQNLLVLEAQV